MESKNTVCTLCRNRCPFDALQCDKGRKFKARQLGSSIEAAQKDLATDEIYLQNGY